MFPKINQLRLNFLTVELPGGTIYVSYKTPVALEVEEDARIRYARRKKFFSVTTSRHLNQYCRGYEQVDEQEWAKCLAQVLGEEASSEEPMEERFWRFVQI